jgi:hypothetical protein
MKFRAKIITPYRRLNSARENIDLPFVLEILESLMEIESLNAMGSEGSDQSFILIGSTSKKLKDLKANIELAFKNHDAYVHLEFLEVKISARDSNPSKRL